MDVRRRNMLLGASVGGAVAALGSASAQSAPSAGRPYAVSVVDSGADPTGVADSTLAFRNAITTASNSSARGGLVVVPAGVYRISGTIVLPQYITLSGPGTPDSTQLDFSTQTSGPAIRISGYGHVAVTGLHIMNPAGDGIDFFDPALTVEAYKNFCHISDVWVSGARNGGSGFAARNTFMTTFERCWAKNCTGHGFNMAGYHTSIKFDTCWANWGEGKHGGNGFNLNNLTYSTLNNCGVDLSSGYGYFLTNCQGIVMNACGAEQSSYSSIGLAASDVWAAQRVDAVAELRGIVINGFFSMAGNSGKHAGWGAYITMYTENNRKIEGSSRDHFSINVPSGIQDVVKGGVDITTNINFPVMQGAKTVS